MPSIKKKSKSELLRKIDALQREIAAIHLFHKLPTVAFLPGSEQLVRAQPGFVSVEQYTLRYLLHPGEIGCVPSARYVSRRVE